MKNNIISEWLKKNKNPEIDKYVKKDISILEKKFKKT
jgi:hypothetical protein